MRPNSHEVHKGTGTVERDDNVLEELEQAIKLYLAKLTAKS